MKLLIVFLVLINVLYAQNIKPEELDNLSLEELMDIKIYSATKSYQRVEEIPANITILTRKDIEKYNYTTLDELLKHVPGLFIIDDTEHFQIGSRGSLGSSFKLMINNNPIPPLRNPRGATSNRNFFATPIDSIDRIEIIKGPQAVTYGSNSMYGSINIITNDFNEKNIISVSKGNNGQEKVFARINQAQENGGFTLNTSFYNTNGISGDLKDSYTEDDLNANPNANKSLEGLLKNEYNTLDFSHRYKNFTTDIIYTKTKYEFYLEPTYRDGNEVEQVEKTLALTYEDEFTKNLAFKINYIYSQKKYKIDDIEELEIIDIGTSNNIKDNRNQIDMHFNYKINEKLNILMGSTYENIKREYAKSSFDKFSATQNHEYEYSTKDIYSKIHYKFNDKFEINSGIRYSLTDSFDIDFKTVYVDTNNIINTTSSTNKKESYLPEFSAIYHINTNNHLKFLFGKANQLKYSSIDEYEEIHSSEINYTYISNKYQINSSIFYNMASNISLFTQDGTNQAISENGDKETRGLEFAIKYKINHNLEASSSITLQNTENKVESGNKTYGADYSPKTLAKLNLTYLNDKTRYSFMFNFIGKMKTSIDGTTGERIGESSNNNITLNSNINHKFNKNLSLNLNINNMLDRDNRIPATSTLTNFNQGAYTKGREFLFTLKYQF